MSNANPEEVSVTVERHGVAVEKSFEPDDFPVPAIAFVIRSSREESVDVRLVDRVPEEIPAEDIGFHPKYGAEFWSVEQGKIVFEREFEAGEEYTTVYGLRASDTDDVSRFLSEPELEEVRPEPGADDSSQVVRDVISGAAADESGEDEPVEPLELNDPTGAAGGSSAGTSVDTGTDATPDDLEAAVSAAETGEEDDADADTGPAVEGLEPAIVEAEDPGAIAGGAPDDIAAALAAQLRRGEIAERDLEVLREAFDAEAGGSTDARISHLQKEVSDLRAYTDALEEFLDENGEAQMLLRELRREVDMVTEEFEAVGERADDAVERVDDFDDDLSSLDEDVSSLESEFGAVRADVTDLESEMADFREDLTETRETVEEVRADVSEVEESMADLGEELREDLRGEVEGIEDRVDDVESDLAEVDALEERLAEVESDLEGLRTVEQHMGELDERLEEVRTDIAELDRMREQLSSVFGAGPSSGGDQGDESDDASDADGDADADDGSGADDGSSDDE